MDTTFIVNFCYGYELNNDFYSVELGKHNHVT